MDTNKILLIICAALAVLLAVLLLRKQPPAVQRFGNAPLPLCTAVAQGGGGQVGQYSGPSNYAYYTGSGTIPCSISNVCSNNAICASNANSSTPFCSNNYNKQCSSSLDLFTGCLSPATFYPGCDKNGQNCSSSCG